MRVSHIWITKKGIVKPHSVDPWLRIKHHARVILKDNSIYSRRLQQILNCQSVPATNYG